MNEIDYKMKKLMVVYPYLNKNMYSPVSLKGKRFLKRVEHQADKHLNGRMISKLQDVPGFKYIKNSNIPDLSYQQPFSYTASNKWAPFFGKWKMKTSNVKLFENDWQLQNNGVSLRYMLASTNFKDELLSSIFGDNWFTNGMKGFNNLANEILNGSTSLQAVAGKPQFFIEVEEFIDSERIINIYDDENNIKAQRIRYDGNNEIYFYKAGKKNDFEYESMFWMSDFLIGIESIQNKCFDDINNLTRYATNMNSVDEMEWISVKEDLNWKFKKRNSSTPNFHVKNKRGGISNTFEYIGTPYIGKEITEINKDRAMSWVNKNIQIINQNEKHKVKTQNKILVISSLCAVSLALVSIIISSVLTSR